MDGDRDAAHLARLAAESRAWPFEEARKLAARVAGRGAGSPVVFETGYGPSGLPHIGTFGEVARTTMVRHAFEVLTEGRFATRLICFSDDMDGLRKVPDNIPERDAFAKFGPIQRPDSAGHVVINGVCLTSIPDPFGDCHSSYGAHMNATLCGFLERFGFDFEFMSATACYQSGLFDRTLLEVVRRHREILDVVLPNVSEERRARYSPFLPVHVDPDGYKRTIHSSVEIVDEAGGVIRYRDPFDETGKRWCETPVTGGGCKLQWRADWAMRWVALGVDYEMSGKDLIDSVRIGGAICRAMGGTPPEGFNYELFLDEDGEKISKSRGNGLTIDEWLTYASPESLSLFMYQAPRRAKRLYFDVIPKNVDDYFTHLAAYHRSGDDAEKIANPVWHIHLGDPPCAEIPVSFALLLNLASASNSEDREILWGFIRNYAGAHASPERYPRLDELVGYAIAYFHDFVKPAKRYRPPDGRERAALERLDRELAALPPSADGETIQNAVYAVGKEAGFESLRDWFTAIYEVLLGQSQGPRFGSFVALYGIGETRALIGRALKGEFADAAV